MLLKSIRLKNILSFHDTSLELRPLNVLIGPNGVGKSNLIDVIGLLKAAPTNLNTAVVRGGNADAWISKAKDAPAEASIECVTEDPSTRYELQFTASERVFLIQRETLEEPLASGRRKPIKHKVYFNRQGTSFSSNGSKSEVPANESVFSRFKRPDDPTPITRLGREFERIRSYADFNTRPESELRTGVSAGVSGETLREDGSNLAMVLHRMYADGSLGQVTKFLEKFNQNYEDLRVTIEGGFAQAQVVERGLSAKIPATRLSDGTLKFICLLAALFNSGGSSLICFEEPELGLHPDALRLVAKALVEVSERVQIIVTTHSTDLIDALSGTPEAVVVCERDFDNGTEFHRLKRLKLEQWLERYSLGELWRKGEIGGNP